MYNRIRAAIIDNGINKELYYELTGKCIDAYKIIDSVCVLDEEDTSKYGFNHGTVCASILTEFAGDAEIISISLGEKWSLPIQNMEATLNWCINNHINIICMSIGVTSLLDMKNLLHLFDTLKNQGIIVVAAGSNIGRITYPASLPSVIGVRYINMASKSISIIDNPIDGIDIEADLAESNVLKKLIDDFRCINLKSNSFITPYVAGKIIEFMQKRDRRDPVSDFKHDFGIYMYADFREYGNGAPLIPREDIPTTLENISIPIIGLIYDDGQAGDKQDDTGQIVAWEQLSISLKKILGRNGYSCILLSTIMDKSIEDNVFELNEEDITSDILRYIQLTQSDIILLHIPKRVLQCNNGKEYIDLVVSGGLMKSDYQEERNILNVTVNPENVETQSEYIYEKILEIFN